MEGLHEVVIKIDCGNLYVKGRDKDGKVIYDGKDHEYFKNHDNAISEIQKELADTFGLKFPMNDWSLVISSLIGLGADCLNVGDYGKNIEIRENAFNRHLYFAPNKKPMERGSYVYKACPE